MKGTVIVCLREWVTERADEATWVRCLDRAGFDPFAIITPGSDVDDGDASRLVGAACSTLGLPLAEVADAFGEHWVRHYSPRLYQKLYERHGSAREFLLDLNRMHASLTKAISGARPPRFRFEWPDERTLVMHYESHRDLIEIAAGMVRAVGRLYNEELGVKPVTRHKLQVTFLGGRAASMQPGRASPLPPTPRPVPGPAGRPSGPPDAAPARGRVAPKNDT